MNEELSWTYIRYPLFYIERLEIPRKVNAVNYTVERKRVVLVQERVDDLKINNLFRTETRLTNLKFFKQPLSHATIGKEI